MEQLPYRSAGQRVAQMRRDLPKRGEDEAALAKLGMGDGEAGPGPAAARPEDDVEIEHACAPTAAAAAAEPTFELFQDIEKGRGRELCFQNRDRVPKAAAGRAERRSRKNARASPNGAELPQRMRRRPNHAGWIAVAVVRAVGADRDRIT